MNNAACLERNIVENTVDWSSFLEKTKTDKKKTKASIMLSLRPQHLPLSKISVQSYKQSSVEATKFCDGENDHVGSFQFSTCWDVWEISYPSCPDVEMNEKVRLVSLEVSRLFFRVVTLEIRLKKAAFTDFARPWLVLRGGHLRTRWSLCRLIHIWEG